MERANLVSTFVKRASNASLQSIHCALTLRAFRSSSKFGKSTSRRSTALSASPGRFRCIPPLQNQIVQRRASSDDASNSDGCLQYTALHELHVENGGKMVPFGGYSMPVRYSDLSVGESHKWTREKSSLFDVGHMYALLRTSSMEI